MDTEKLTIISLLMISSVLMLWIGILTLRRRTMAGPAANALAICLFGVSIYSFGYALEVSSMTLSTIMLWVRVEHIGIQSIAPTWLIFSIYQTGRGKALTLPRIIAIYIIPLILLLLAQTLGSLNILHPNPRITITGPYAIFNYDRSILIYISLIYQSLCVLASTILFTILFVKTSPAFRKQTIIFLVGSLIPWVGGVIYTLGLAPYNLDLTPITFTVSSLVLAIGFFRFQIMEIIPVARDIIFDGMRDGVLVLDHRDRVMDFNQRMQQMIPDIQKNKIGKLIYDEIEAYPDLLKLIREATVDQMEPQEFDLGGNQYRTSITPLLNKYSKRAGKIITFHDFTETRQLMDKLEEFASLDSLTCVYNRRYFFMLTEQEIQRIRRYGGKLSLIILDLDRFKMVNDHFGHIAGDHVLKTVADTCRDSIRKVDILGRFGGEEFVILLPETDVKDAEILANRIREDIAKISLPELTSSYKITASLGVADMGAARDISMEDLLRQADRALYNAKETGRNRVCVYSQEQETKHQP
ncbi:MAG: hypothetical protein C0391_07270 [Anaerolinea sp.]|nr:hypothetical protein [Anaerolinea sp.]